MLTIKIKTSEGNYFIKSKWSNQIIQDDLDCIIIDGEEIEDKIKKFEKENNTKYDYSIDFNNRLITFNLKDGRNQNVKLFNFLEHLFYYKCPICEKKYYAEITYSEGLILDRVNISAPEAGNYGGFYDGIHYEANMCVNCWHEIAKKLPANIHNDRPYAITVEYQKIDWDILHIRKIKLIDVHGWNENLTKLRGLVFPVLSMEEFKNTFFKRLTCIYPKEEVEMTDIYFDEILEEE